MSQTNQIIVDCERMKFPFTGLYSFCKELGNALQRQWPPDCHLGFYVRKKEEGIFGKDASYFTQKSLHKYLSFQLPACRIWHCTYQGSQYLPGNSRKTKLVATIHDLNFLYEKESLYKQKKYLRKMQRLIDRADAIVAISHYVKKDIDAHLDTKGKSIRVIYNGRNMPGNFEFCPPLGNFEKPFFFAMGTVTAKKNFHVLPALLLKNDQDLVIAGITQCESYRNKIVDEARRLGLENRVRLIGAVSEAEKYWLLKHCTAFAFPSLAEGFGLPVIEAMQLGTPVLLSTHTSLPEIGGPHAFYFESFDDEEVSRKAAQLLQKEFSEKEKNERIRWAEQFNWDKAAREYIAIYRALLQPGGVPDA